jgi:hypothetical protein
VSILHRRIFSFDDLVCRERDLVRRWSAPVEQGAALHLPWLTDSLRNAYTKLAADGSRQIRDTEFAGGNRRCCHAASLALTTSARKNLSSLACLA